MRNHVKITAQLPVFALACAGIASAQPAEGPPPGHGKDHFIAAYDSNADGAVTADEFEAARAAGHARVDADHNGAASEAEYVAEFESRLTETGEARAAQVRQAHVRFGVLDADHDGALTLAEFQAAGQRIFQRLDTDENGTIDAADGADRY